MTTDDLRKLALAATPGPWTLNKLGYSATYVVSNFVEPSVGAAYYEQDAAYIAACSPERILAMLAVIDAAKAMRPFVIRGEVDSEPPIRAFDAALAALEGDK